MLGRSGVYAGWSMQAVRVRHRDIPCSDGVVEGSVMQNNPIAIMRMFRADRLRREAQLHRIVVNPADPASNDRKWDRDTAVFAVCCILAYAAFCLALLWML